jgi:23S rRNA (cytidine1920-2'-O)/16S rRNA (cytidine1409-2'-O)-methyltransferase
VNIEGTNARAIPDGLVPTVDWIVTDVSFISLEKALPIPLSLARKGAILVALVKPQFEVGRSHIGKGGIVRDQEAKSRARDRIEAFLQAEGWQITHRGESPIKGGDGNVEYLVAARRI